MKLGRISLALTFLAAACGPWVPEGMRAPSRETDTEGSVSATSTTSTTTTGHPDDDGSTSTCGNEDDEFGERCSSPDLSGTSFIDPPDCDIDPNFPGTPRCLPIECSTFEQNCPDGEKCMAWANDGGNAWNATRCTPVAPEAPAIGEPCQVEGSGVSGVDNCELGAMCFHVDPETNEGTCVPQCGGTLQQPSCSETTEVCVIAGDGSLALCLPDCDPRDPAACAEGQGCYPFDGSFACAPTGAGMVVDSSVCRTPTACEPGQVCIADEAGPQCDDPPCCTPWCDTANPDPACVAPSVCTGFYEPDAAPVGFETLGLCLP